jgi:bifunctional DNA-binding transcriptional regulator/antitoxin component of YhaV-PrlF toxin-antitoxin module
MVMANRAHESTVGPKGQTTVPVEIRKQLAAKAGTKLSWSSMSDGTIIVRAKTRRLSDLVGILKAPEGVHVSIEDMNPGTQSDVEQAEMRRSRREALDRIEDETSDLMLREVNKAKAAKRHWVKKG